MPRGSRTGAAAALAGLVALTILAGACDPGTPPAAPWPAFVDIAPAAGLTRPHTGGGTDKAFIVEAKGGGGALLDAEGDGDLDIYWVNGATLQDPGGAGNALYVNAGSGTFTDVADAAGVRGRGWGMGAASADVDNDGAADLYVTCLEADLLYHNRAGPGAPSFIDASDQPGIAAPAWSTGAAFGDVDRDGDLDLYVSRYARFDDDDLTPLGGRWRGVPVFMGPMDLEPEADLLLRNDGGRFTEISVEAGVAGVRPAYGLGVLAVDGDDDGDLDIFVANDSEPNFWFRNDGGRFVEAGLDAGVAYCGHGTAQASMGAAWGDVDGDLAPDLVLTHFEGDHNTLYRNLGDGRFTDATARAELDAASTAAVGFGVTLVDVDLDGDRDLFVANGHVYPQIERAGTGIGYAQPNRLYENLGDGRFRLRPTAGLDDPHVSRTALAGDFDDDGDLDLYVHNLNDRPSLLRSDGAAGHWLGVRLVGTRGNRDGVGARLWLHAGGRVQLRDALRGSSFLGSQDPRLHFGLGPVAAADSLVVRWPSGRRQVVAAPLVDRYLRVVED